MTQDSNQLTDDPTSSSPANDDLKIVFAPGCFDNFDGTQEELNELITEIQRLVTSGEFLSQAEPISDEEVEAMMETGKNRTRQ